MKDETDLVTHGILDAAAATDAAPAPARGRKSAPAAQSKETPANALAIAQDFGAANELAAIVHAQTERVGALARQLNYQGSTDPDVLENSAKDAIRRIGAGIFELGGYLLLLKEACGHGKFLPTLERLGLGVDAAGRYMAVTRRFANSASTRNLVELGVTKLVELLPLDDEQLEDLTGIGQTGELALDDVARMSVKQLRAAVREERAERAADQKLLEAKGKQIDRLHNKIARFDAAEPDEQLADLKRRATAVAGDAEGLVLGALRQALAALAQHAQAHGDARALQGVYMAGLVGQVQARLQALRDEFDLPDVSSAAQAELAAEVAQWAN